MFNISQNYHPAIHGRRFRLYGISGNVGLEEYDTQSTQVHLFTPFEQYVLALDTFKLFTKCKYYKMQQLHLI